MNLQFKRTAAAACSAMLVCSVFSACGSKPAEEPAVTAASDGETTTSKFSGNKASKPTVPANLPDGTSHEDRTALTTQQSELNDALSFAQSGMIADAREMLSYVERDTLDDNQMLLYDMILEMLDAAENSGSSNFTADDAIKLVEEKYDITLPQSAHGLQAQTDDNGRQYYHMQIEIPAQNAKKIINVYQDGEISELSSEPYAFG